MSRGKLGTLAAVALLLAASSTCNKPDPVVGAVETPEPKPVVAPEAPWPGQPHEGGLLGVAVDHRGKAVLSVDDKGGARLWTKLDDSRTPLPIPLPFDPKVAPQLDVIADEVGWRALSVREDETTLVAIDASGHTEVRAQMRGPTAALLLPGGGTLRAAGDTLSVLGSDGKPGKTITVPDPVVSLLPTPSRKAVLVVSGQWQETDIPVLWSGGDHVRVFVGTLTAVTIGKDGKLAVRGAPRPFTSSEAPDPFGYAFSENGRHAAYPVYPDMDEAESDVMLEVRTVAIELETGVTKEHEYAGDWVTFNDDNELEWEGKEGQTVTPPLLDELRRASFGGGVWARPDGPWLRLATDEWDRWLGRARFEPQKVAFSPDGKRMIWSEHQGEENQSMVVRFGAPEDDVIGEPEVLEGVQWVTGMVWHAPDAVLLVGMEGDLMLLDPDRLKVKLVDRIEPAPRVEHDPRSGVTHLSGWDSFGYVVPWRDGKPGGALNLERFLEVDDAMDTGLLRGDKRGIWVLLAKGVAEVGIDELRADTPKLNPAAQSRDAREIFDVAWARDGERIIDWGDEWEIAGDKPARWQRDTPVFGPLRPAPNGQAVLTLPECDDKPWHIGVHPGPAADLGPGDSYLQEVPRHSDIRWSPDGKLVAIAGGEQGGMLFDVATKTVVRHWHSGAFAMRDEVPPDNAALLGRCRSLMDLEYEHYYE